MDQKLDIAILTVLRNMDRDFLSVEYKMLTYNKNTLNLAIGTTFFTAKDNSLLTKMSPPSSQHRILFAGDPHGDFTPLIAAVHEYKPEAVVLLGDYDLEMPLENYLREIVDLTEIWWIAGNHDFQSPGHYKNLFHSGLADHGLHLKVTEIAGLRIAGLSGIFLGRVWYPPRAPVWTSKQQFLSSSMASLRNGGISLKYRSAIWHDEFEALKSLKADILVSHEAPSSHRYGFSVISELAAAMEVKNIFHGHLHEHYSATVKNKINVVGVADKSVVDLAGNTLMTTARLISVNSKNSFYGTVR